jgi:hypothetical protein
MTQTMEQIIQASQYIFIFTFLYFSLFLFIKIIFSIPEKQGKLLLSFLGLNEKEEYRFTKVFTTFMDVKNVFHQKYVYFNNFRKLPLILMSGFTMQW